MTARKKRLPKRNQQVARGAAANDDWANVPRLELGVTDDALAETLRAAFRVVLTHPVAAQAAVSALVAEGRRFAQTPDGRRWKAALATSQLVRRGRALWEGSPLGVLEDEPGTVLPSAVLDAIVQATQRDNLFAILRQLALPTSQAEPS